MNIDFSPEKSLFSLPVVRWCAGTSAIIAITITIAITFSLRHLPFDLSAHGFNYFSELYKVPAAFLAIGFTLVGLCAANHRSEQTKRQIERTTSQIALTNNQIELTKSQNNFSNYYKHIDEFEKYFNENNHGIGNNLKFSRSLHGNIFTKSRDGNYEIDERFIALLHNFLISILDLSKGLKSKNTWQEAVYAMSIKMKEYLKNTKISSGVGVLFVEKINSKKYKESRGWCMKDFIRQIFSIIKTVDEILKFDPQYRSLEIVTDFIKIDLNLVPDEELGDGDFYPVYLHRIIYEGKNQPRSVDYSEENIATDIPK
ncbi:hypothetical protein [Janthinobacterium sp. HLX7-2]|uniref:hypothetical protein n=1 Tax=Janthinobacterium sp. HLX7-2 TaxID=1259331 RepID=UPI003F23B4C3